MTPNLSTLGDPPAGMSRRSFFRAGGLGIIAAAGAKSLVACDNNRGSDTSLGEVTYVSFLPFDTLSYAAEMMAIAGGYAAEHSIDLQVEEARGTAPALQAVISGVGLIARCNTIDLVLARQEGQPLVNIGTIGRGPAQRINFSQRNRLSSPQDFVGKTIGIPSEGGSTENNLRLTLQHGGIDPDDVTMQVVAPTPASWEMIGRGQIDGFLTSPDQSFLLQEMEDEADAVVLGDLAPVVSDRQYFVTTEEHIENSAEQVRAYLAALSDAVESIVDDPPSAIATLREEYSFSSLDSDSVAADAIDVQIENFVNNDEPDPLYTEADIWAEGLQELEGAGFIDPVEDPDSWFNNSLLQS
ncbi:ABC transporter substrate-binding protein [Nesterenkonia haasae]|uniref:ABC transporter substrate-binding protein n=1 Tax=Nesterenkonia haasae TaxID=2587813 RepID=UPI001F43B79F|nr:ABC transporter substrate-binding protein [Nesterenkonia haasae]